MPQNRYIHVSNEDAPDTPDLRADPYQDVETNDFAVSLQEAINSLPDDVREALVLVSLDGMGYQEASNIIGVPVGTVKTRVFRARKLLRGHLKKHGKEDFIKE